MVNGGASKKKLAHRRQAETPVPLILKPAFQAGLDRLAACRGQPLARLPLEFLLSSSARSVLIVIPNEAGWSWGGVGEGSPRSDWSGLAATPLLDQVRLESRSHAAN